MCKKSLQLDKVTKDYTLYTAKGPSARTVCIKQSIGFLYNFPLAFFVKSTAGDSETGPFADCPR
jgi:hypothetical protein